MQDQTNSPSLTRVQVRPKAVQGLNLEELQQKLQAHSEQERKAEEERKHQAALLVVPTRDELVARCNAILRNERFISTTDRIYTNTIKEIKKNNPVISERELASKLHATMISHVGKQFKLFYKSQHKDWTNHKDAANTLQQEAIRAYLSKKPELAIIYTSSCCVIL